MAYKTDRMGRLIDLGKKGARLVTGGPATKEMLKEGPRVEMGMAAPAKLPAGFAKAVGETFAKSGGTMGRRAIGASLRSRGMKEATEKVTHRMMRGLGIEGKGGLSRKVTAMEKAGRTPPPPKQMTGARKAVKETRALGGTFEGRNSPGARGPRRAGSVITAKIKDITKQQTSRSGQKVHHQTGSSGESVRATREFERGLKKLAKERARG